MKHIPRLRFVVFRLIKVESWVFHVWQFDLLITLLFFIVSSEDYVCYHLIQVIGRRLKGARLDIFHNN